MRMHCCMRRYAYSMRMQCCMRRARLCVHAIYLVYTCMQMPRHASVCLPRIYLCSERRRESVSSAWARHGKVAAGDPNPPLPTATPTFSEPQRRHERARERERVSERRERDQRDAPCPRPRAAMPGCCCAICAYGFAASMCRFGSPATLRRRRWYLYFVRVKT